MTSDELRLIRPDPAWRDAYLACAEDYLAAGETEGRFVHRLTEARRDFDGLVRRSQRESQGIDLPPGWVPSTEYWLVRDDQILGASGLRHRLTDALRVEGGHIGYTIRPSERRKGYGTRLLALTLEKARQHGLRRVLVTCDKDNIASARIIRHNGGRLAGEAPSPRSGKPVQQYWIAL